MILQYLNEYKTRLQLATILRTPDRKVRKRIEELRKQGYKIYSNPTGKGYKLATTEKEENELFRTYASRIESETETLRRMFGNDKVRNFLMKQIIMINEEEKDG